MSLLAVLVGLVLLAVGGELVVRGASRLAVAVGIRPVVVGLTVVAFGTSLPELAVTVGSVLGGSPDVAVGNVVGSNIYNVLLVLGMGAIVAPLIVQQRIVRADVPLLIGVSVLFWALASDGRIDRVDGLPLLLLLVAYIGVAVRDGRRERRNIRDEYEESLPPGPRTGDRKVVLLALILGGLVVLVAGSWAVEGPGTCVVCEAMSPARDALDPHPAIGVITVSLRPELLHQGASRATHGWHHAGCA